MVLSHLYNYGGELRQLIQDDKGIVCILCWGLPGSTHEDDALRALRCCLGCQSDILAQSVGTSIGVTSGKAICGYVGSKARSEYCMMGDVVNMAARLMSKATGDIWCTPTIYQKCHGKIAFSKLKAIHVKGKSDPLDVYRVTGLSSIEETTKIEKKRVAIIGRAAEVSTLRDVMVEFAVHGEGRVVTVEGEMGIGKSHLMRECFKLAQLVFNAQQLSRVACQERTKLQPYTTWTDIVTPLLPKTGARLRPAA